MSVLVLTSAFAAVLALFNNSARYLYALARDGALPTILARTHPRHHSPHIAGIVLSVGLVLVFVIAVLMRLDPLVNVATALAGVGSVGLMAMLGLTALAIPVFFARRSIFGVADTLAPALGGLVILVATTIAFLNYSALTGVDSAVINHLPYALILMFSIGVGQALWLRTRQPGRYALIGSTRVTTDDCSLSNRSLRQATMNALANDLSVLGPRQSCVFRRAPPALHRWKIR